MTYAEKREYLPQIAATLNKGKCSDLDPRKARNLYIILAAGYLAIMIGAIVIISVLQADSPNLIWYIVTAVGVGILVQLAVFLIFFYYGKLIKRVSGWLDDGVVLTADARQIGAEEMDWGDSVFSTPAVKIKVYFKFENKTYSYESANRAGSKYLKGYAYFWRRYADREIRIIYSPRYEEVMILKDL